MMAWGRGGVGAWERWRRGVGVIVILSFSVVSLSCFSERDAAAPIVIEGECAIPLSAIGPNKVVVAIRDFSFYPDTVRVRPGTEVTWVNCETTIQDFHTATSSSGLWTSGAINRAESFMHRFNSNGSFEYFCEPHPFMRGTVIVQ